MGSQCKPQFHLTCTVACTALSSCPRPWRPGRLQSPGVRSGWAPAAAAVWGWGCRQGPRTRQPFGGTMGRKAGSEGLSTCLGFAPLF